MDSDITADDPYITGLIQDAAEFCESEIWGHRQLLSATYDVPVVSWWDGPLCLPRPPLQALLSASYFDSFGTAQTAASSLYLIRTPVRSPGTVERAPNQSWPTTQTDRRFPVTLRMTCGYGPSTTIAGSISTGIQTVTPASMFGIFVGTRLWIDVGAKEELVTVTAGDATTFSAAFAQAHTGPVIVSPGIPGRVRRAIFYTVAHWYKSREPLGPGKQMDLTVDRLLSGAGWGSYA